MEKHKDIELMENILEAIDNAIDEEREHALWHDFQEGETHLDKDGLFNRVAESLTKIDRMKRPA